MLTEQETVPALGHDYHAVEGTEAAPTCTVEGKEADQKCSRCGSVIIGASIPATGHTVVTDHAVEPTCTETGLTAGSHCSVCGEVLAEQETVPALGHDYHTVEGTAAAPTCTAAGKEADQKCSRCDSTISGAPVPATGHTAMEDPAVDPTCTETGLTAGSHCSVCGEVLVAQEMILALGHDWGEPAYSWAEDNSKVTAVHTCKRNGSHTETETVSTTSEVTKPATCTEKGETTYTAVFENEAFETQTKTVKDIDALGHSYGEPIWAWATDFSSAAAVFTCEHDTSHMETVDAEVIHEPQADGTTVHTATAVFLGKTYTDVKMQAAPELTVWDQDSTDGIELSWSVIESAAGYKIFAVKDEQEIPLATVTEPNYLVPQVLDPNKKPIELMMGETYGYLIVAVDEGGHEITWGTHDDFYNPFRDDVADDSPSFGYIAWAYNNGLVTGTSHTRFDPEGSTTRMNFVMILYKMHGSPKASGENPFEDITGSKTVRAVLWAVQKGIITGVDDTHFEPDGDCSRALFVEVLCRYNEQYPII